MKITKRQLSNLIEAFYNHPDLGTLAYHKDKYDFIEGYDDDYQDIITDLASGDEEYRKQAVALAGGIDSSYSDYGNLEDSMRDQLGDATWQTEGSYHKSGDLSVILNNDLYAEFIPGYLQDDKYKGAWNYDDKKSQLSITILLLSKKAKNVGYIDDLFTFYTTDPDYKYPKGETIRWEVMIAQGRKYKFYYVSNVSDLNQLIGQYLNE